MGEATEVALRVLAEKVGLPGYADMPASLEQLSKRERATFCNDYWQKDQHRVSSNPLLQPVSALARARHENVVYIRCRSCSLLRQMQGQFPDGQERRHGHGRGPPWSP